MNIDAKQIRALLTATPFKPFRLQARRGGPCDVTSPAFVLLSTTAVHIGSDPDADGIATGVRMVPLAQVDSIDML